MKTAIVILNWNTEEYLRKFLPGVIASAPKDAEVIVADNDSSDASVPSLAQFFPSVRRICFQENHGFTGGYNRALGLIKDEGFEYYILLNSDIEVKEGWIEPLASWMDSHPECGACSPKLHSYKDKDSFEYAGAAGGYLDAFGYPFCRGRVLNMVEKDEGQYDNGVKDIFWGTGACLMIRSKLFHQLGGLDDRFFAHMEEIDLCWRIQLAGYKVCAVPDSTVWHLGGGTLPAASPWKLKLNYRNNLLLLNNNLAKSYALEKYIKHGKIGKASAAGLRKAAFMLKLRMILDGISAAIYFITGRYSYFKSVLEAHREYKKLQRKVSREEVGEYISVQGKKAFIRGWYNGWIVPQALITKKKVWKTVRNL